MLDPNQTEVLIQVVAISFTIGAAVGGAIGAGLTGYHRTRGARRRHAATAARNALAFFQKEAQKLDAADLIRLQAELFHYYFRVLKMAERGWPRYSARNVEKFIGKFPRGSNEENESV